MVRVTLHFKFGEEGCLAAFCCEVFGSPRLKFTLAHWLFFILIGFAGLFVLVLPQVIVALIGRH